MGMSSLVFCVLCFVHYGEVDYPDFTPAFYSLSARILISLWYTHGSSTWNVNTQIYFPNMPPAATRETCLQMPLVDMHSLPAAAPCSIRCWLSSSTIHLLIWLLQIGRHAKTNSSLQCLTKQCFKAAASDSCTMHLLFAAAAAIPAEDAAAAAVVPAVAAAVPAKAAAVPAEETAAAVAVAAVVPAVAAAVSAEETTRAHLHKLPSFIHILEEQPHQEEDIRDQDAMHQSPYCWVWSCHTGPGTLDH